MKRLLSTIRIYVDMDATREGGSSYTHWRKNEDDFEIYLRPRADRGFGPAGKDTKNILAHELGHVVAHLFRTPISERSGTPETTTNEQLAAEKEAWAFSEKMVPGITRMPVYKQPMKDFERAVREWPDTPMSEIEVPINPDK